MTKAEEKVRRFMDLVYGLEVWQNADLLSRALPEYNKLHEDMIKGQEALEDMDELIHLNSIKLLEKNILLEKEIMRLNNLLDEVPVLRGKDAEAFEEYSNRKATPEEIAFLEECDRIYSMHDPDKKNKDIVNRLSNLIESIRPLDSSTISHIFGHGSPSVFIQIMGAYVMDGNKDYIPEHIKGN